MEGFKTIILKTFVQTKLDATSNPIGFFIFLKESHNDALLECTGQKLEELKNYPELCQVLSENGIKKLPDWRKHDNSSKKDKKISDR